MYYENTYRVGARDVDPFNQCRPSSMMDFLQEAATEAAVELHVSREEMVARYHVFWMLARIWYRLDRPVCWDERVTIRTWHRGSRGASMYRDFDLLMDGKPIGEAVSVWVLADLDTHKLFRLGNVREFDDTSGGALCKEKLLPRLKVPVPLVPTQARALHYSDTDVNGHVNNVRYADFACDALEMQRLGQGRFVSSVQIGYLKECRAGETIRLSTGCENGTWYVQGDGEEGKPRFDAALTMSPLDKP
ncbi:acyl-[acyl-carrier-protein] thioesterase [Intestinimonas butyriciproducens]|uniref:acyl-[acyl-carrier-protein] thioesterase n=1 Tax=Intestinimonas butyriciproducens TaxID=1297617 RepID=UPI00189CC4C5|nr:acyl-ACP thioesterase domain-containing protein [Intestinimonas butyriciproducens]